MQQYLNLLQNILDNGVEKESGRANMPNTIGISFGTIRMNLQEGFPLLTTKKMYLKGIIHELLWFLRGETNIKYLVDNNVNIWNGDAYRWYQTKCKECNIEMLLKTQEEFIEAVKNHVRIYVSDCGERIIQYNDQPLDTDLIILVHNLGYVVGNLGKVYGHQWRNQNGVDQIKEVLDGLRSNPYSRYHIIDAWNKADFKDMALPPCHLLYQFIVRPMTFEERKAMIPEDTPGFLSHADFDCCNMPKFFLDLNMYQRSCDTFLGVPFNLASMSLLLMLFAEVSGMLPGVATWIGGDTHLYVDHIPVVREQLERVPYDLPRLVITKEFQSLEDILNLTVDDFELIGYTWHPAIKAELFTGVKKQ